MIIAHLNTSDNRGGAARAANRLHSSLQDSNVLSHLVVQKKITDGVGIIGPTKRFEKLSGLSRPYADLLINKVTGTKFSSFSVSRAPNFHLRQEVNKVSADIIHLHWICRGLINIEQIARLPLPIVWTLHDMWPFTGGCHYSWQCDKYISGCEHCPQASGGIGIDVSKWIWRRKNSSWKRKEIVVVAPSSWMAKCAKSSRLFQDYRIEHIPNGIDITGFKPLEQKICREILNLPNDKHLVLFGAMDATTDKRKGFDKLKAALMLLGQDKISSENIEIVVFGASSSPHDLNLNLPVTFTGQIHDDITLSVLYSAADVVVIPSLEDNLPNVALEAIACGTPCVAFNVGGVADMIDHLKTGYLAEPYTSEDLAKGIIWILEDSQRLRELSERCRTKVLDEFDGRKIAQRHIDLYQDILATQIR